RAARSARSRTSWPPPSRGRSPGVHDPPDPRRAWRDAHARRRAGVPGDTRGLPPLRRLARRAGRRARFRRGAGGRRPAAGRACGGDPLARRGRLSRELAERAVAWMEPTSRDNGSRSGKPKAVTRITLLTDFGTADGYVAAMKGVIAARAPGVVVDDASHDVPPGDVAAAAWTLSRYWNLYPPGTVHVVVVDPGVGSERRALAAEVDGRLFVAPDNGVLTWVLAEAGDAAVVAIEAARLFRTPVSATFHGRDVFAPVAAELARRAGAGPSRFREVLADLGPEVADP